MTVESTNYDLWAKFCLPPVLVNQVLLEHSLTHLLTYVSKNTDRVSISAFTQPCGAPWPLFSLTHLKIHGVFLNMCSVQRCSVQFSSVQSLSRVWLFATPWTAARQASLSITHSRSLPKLMSIESVMPSSHLIFCRPLLLLPPVPPRISQRCYNSLIRICRPSHP